MLRTSEFWTAIATAVGSALVAFGVVPQEQWDKLLYPALVYIIARVTSKFVKAVGK